LISENDNITLFEAAFKSDQKFVRVDILKKEGSVLNIYEVKSKSCKGGVVTEGKKELLEDVSFQTQVLKEIYSEYTIHSYLYLLDKLKITSIEGLAGWFKESATEENESERDELPAENGSKFKKVLVEFIFEDDPSKIQELNDDNLMTQILVDNEVDEMLSEIKSRSELFIGLIKGNDPSEHFEINKECKKCEFNLGEETIKNGYRECWGDLTDVNPHIFDLYYGGSIKKDKVYYLNELISAGNVGFSDLDIERFKTSKGVFGVNGLRQKLQYENTLSDEEWVSSDLKSELQKLVYPLHFIDFETYSGAIPHHKGMKPYEKVAFQWSCHTIRSEGSDPVHSEFLNSGHNFPNFEFAVKLMDQIGDEGTPLMWSHFENTILRDILKQMDTRSYVNDDLKNWLTDITKGENREGRFVDMNALTLKHYFHPDMKGKTSIKKVLPAIWNNNESIRNDPWFHKYNSGDNVVSNPYDSLKPITYETENVNEYEEEEIVKDGTSAMRVYHELMFILPPEDEEKKDNLRQQLLQYCELDTMAMVIIWKHWVSMCGLI